MRLCCGKSRSHFGWFLNKVVIAKEGGQRGPMMHHSSLTAREVEQCVPLIAAYQNIVEGDVDLCSHVREHRIICGTDRLLEHLISCHVGATTSGMTLLLAVGAFNLRPVGWLWATTKIVARLNALSSASAEGLSKSMVGSDEAASRLFFRARSKSVLIVWSGDEADI